MCIYLIYLTSCKQNLLSPDKYYRVYTYPIRETVRGSKVINPTKASAPFLHAHSFSDLFNVFCFDDYGTRHKIMDSAFSFIGKQNNQLTVYPDIV